MAEVVTGNVTGYVNMWPEKMDAAISDVRREAAEHTNEIVKEGLKGDYNTQGAIKDARFDINSRLGQSTTDIIRDVDRVGDRADERFFTIARDTADLRAQVVAQQQQMVAGFLGTSKDIELNALKTQLAVKEDGAQTRALINDLKNSDLNRMLIERNAEIVEERGHGRHWRGHYDQAQWAALNNQLQAFQSQLQETRQGMVNFGTMAGVGQSSTSNNVR